MQSFRERCGYHSNQQNFQPTSQDSSRLENYRHQSQPGLNCERQRMVAKEYYAQPSFQGYENSAVEKYHRGTKPLPGQQLQVRPAFPAYGTVQDNSAYPAQFSGEEALQNWGSSPQSLAGGVAKYEEALMKKTAVPADSRQYQEQAAQLPFQAHPLHLPQQQQTTVAYNKLQRQKIQNDVSSFSQPPHFTQHSQSFPPSSTYSTVQGHSVHTYKSCSAPSNQHQERPVAGANMASAQRVQSLHGYPPNRIAYDQQSSLQSRHHGQETLHYQNIAKYQHYNQQNQTYCQSDTQVRTPEQYYPAFSPGSSHSPARSVGRSPSYSSTPSPLMPNLENFQYNQQPLNTTNFPAGMPDHSHFMPLLNPSPTDTSSPDHQPGKCKNLQKDKLAENILSDLSLQSLSALTSQVENINAVQKLLSKSVIPQKKSIKNPHRTPEQLKGQHCSPENNAYSMDQIGTPVSDRLSTPQSTHNEAQDTDYMSGSEDPLERGYLFCDQSRSPARANHNKAKPESLSTCSVTSPDNMSVKSDDSFQSINATLPLGSFAKYVTSDGECPQLLGNALSQDELSSEIIALQDAINSEKTDKDWEMKLLTCNVRSPGIGEMVKDSESCMKNSMKENVVSNSSKDLGKSPFQLENNRACLDPAAKRAWSSPQNHNALCEPLKLKKSPVGNNCTDFSKEAFQDTGADYSTSETKKAHHVAGTLEYNSKNTLPTAIPSGSYSCYSNSIVNPASTKNAEAFGWLDKSINESCLRWKDLEMSLNLSDPEKDLFQGKLIGLNKEQKRTSQDEQRTCQNESIEKLQKVVEMTEEEEEAIRYPDANKAENERWLEDARNCCADSEFQDISLIGSPEVKVSDLEQGEYSPLCDISSPERKSVMDDTSPSRCREKAPVVSSEGTLESPAEDMTTDVKEKSTSAPHLTSQSVMLLGPVIGTESKVQSWFGSSLPHIEDEEEMNSREVTDKEADKLQPEKILPEDLNSQIVPESNMKMNMEDRHENKSHHRKNTNSSVSEFGESRETTPDLSKNIQVFVTVPDHSTVSGNQTESGKEHAKTHVSMKDVDQIGHIQMPTSVNHIVDIQARIKNVDQTTQIQAPTELVSNAGKIQDRLKHVDQTRHSHTSTENGAHTGTVQVQMKRTDQSRDTQGASKSVDQTGHTPAPSESAKLLAHTQTPKKTIAETIHRDVLTENVDQAMTKSVDQCTSIQSVGKGVTQCSHMQAPMESFDQTIHVQAPVESLDQAGDSQLPMKSVTQHIHIESTTGNVTQGTDSQALVKSMHQRADIQSPTESTHQSAPNQTSSESVKENIPIQDPPEILHPMVAIRTSLERACYIADIQAPMDSADQKIHNPIPTEGISQVKHSKPSIESVHQTVYIRAPARTVDETAHIQTTAKQVHEIGDTQAQVNPEHQTVNMQSLHQTMCIQAPMKTVSKSEDGQLSVRTVSETNDLPLPMEYADETTTIQAKMKCVHQTTNDTPVPMKSVGQHKESQTALSTVRQTAGIEVVKSIPKATEIKGPVKSVDETNKLQDPLKNTNDRQALIEIMHQAEYIQAAPELESDDSQATKIIHKIKGLKASLERVNDANNLKIPVEGVDQIDDLEIQMESMTGAESLQAPLEIVQQTDHLWVTQVKSVDKTVYLPASTESLQRFAPFQPPMDNVVQNQVPAFIATGTPARMCTRSSTASAEPQATGPRQGKLAKRVARGMKLRAALKTGLQDGTLIEEGVRTSHDDLSASLSQDDSGNQKAKNTDDQLLTARNQRSMILRSRNKTQELFHMKRRHEKRATEVRLKNCKVTKPMGAGSRLTSRAFQLACRGAEKMQGPARGPKLAKASIGGKGPGRPPLHSLKRKSSLISPIPAKKRNLILRRNSSSKEQKQVGRPRLFKKRPLVKTANPPKLHASGPCKTALRKPAGRPPGGAGLKLSPRAASQGELKTKVLPPRKGRGLKLGAIVQNMSPPQLKKPLGAIAAPASSSYTEGELGGGASPPDRALRHAGLLCAEAAGGGSSSRSLGCQAAAEQLCRNTNRALKGRLPSQGKRPSAESIGDGEACASEEAPPASSMGTRRAAEAQRSPGARTRKCRPATGPGLATEREACLSPVAAAAAALLRQSPRDKMQQRRRRRQEPSSEDEEDSTREEEEEEEEEEGAPESKRPLGRPRKRHNNHATFNGYSKRQRIGLSPSKAKKKAKSRKGRTKRRQAPIVCPTEPEIRLKYLACKPLQRVESRAKLFAPYVQLVRKEPFSTVCTVINSPVDEVALQQLECPSLSGATSARDHKRPTLPSSSAMKLGPLVSKAVPVTCLMCCICRNPSNHRDLGDLCGPYYPEDCLPKKKSRLKEKVMKMEGLSDLPLLSPDRTHRATEGGCSASVAAIDKHPELDCAAKQTLRSSTRGLYRKLQSCYCCDGRAEGEEAEKSRRHQCSKASLVSPSNESASETQEHWVHEACVIWTRGVYLVGGKLYGLQDAAEMAAKVVCPACQLSGASVSCCHKGCAQTYHFTCANETGCLLNEDNFSLRCLKHKRQLL